MTYNTRYAAIHGREEMTDVQPLDEMYCISSKSILQRLELILAEKTRGLNMAFVDSHLRFQEGLCKQKIR
jgi:hypothetical protein